MLLMNLHEEQRCKLLPGNIFLLHKGLVTLQHSTRESDGVGKSSNVSQCAVNFGNQACKMCVVQTLLALHVKRSYCAGTQMTSKTLTAVNQCTAAHAIAQRMQMMMRSWQTLPLNCAMKVQAVYKSQPLNGFTHQKH